MRSPPTTTPSPTGCRALRSYGARVKHHNEIEGANSRLDEVQAAFLAVKLPHLDGWVRRRAEVAAAYRAGLAGLPALTLPAEAPAGTRHAWHVYNVHHPRRDTPAGPQARGRAQCYYPVPPHLSPAYARLGYGPGDFPVTERRPPPAWPSRCRPSSPATSRRR